MNNIPIKTDSATISNVPENAHMCHHIYKKALILASATLFSLSASVNLYAENTATELPGLGLSYTLSEKMEESGLHVYSNNYTNLNHLGILNMRTEYADLFYVLVYPEASYAEESEADHYSTRFEQRFPGTVCQEDTFGDMHYTSIDLTGSLQPADYESEVWESITAQAELCKDFMSTISYSDLTMAALTFDSVNLDGEQVTDEIYKDKKITVLNVWATYCNPCINEMPELAKWETEMGEDAQILYLCSDIFSTDSSNIPLAEQIADKSGINRKNVIYNLPGTCADAVNTVTGVPTTFFIDQNGVVLEDFVVGASVEEYKKILEQYLSK